MALDIDCIAYPIGVFSSENMVKSNFIERRARCIGRDMPSDSVYSPVSIRNYNSRIPEYRILNLFSISKSPGYGGCWSKEMVFR